MADIMETGPGAALPVNSATMSVTPGTVGSNAPVYHQLRLFMFARQLCWIPVTLQESQTMCRCRSGNVRL